MSREEKIKEIKELKNKLDKEGIDSNIVPQCENDPDTIDVKLDLRLSYLRCLAGKISKQQFGTESVLIMASTLELIFDGKHSFYGTNVDLTGFRAEMEKKLENIKDYNTLQSELEEKTKCIIESNRK